MRGGHVPRKRFGQNFLRDGRVIERIVAAVDARPGQHVVEIGPGQGALTRPLLASGARLTTLEIDRDLAAALHDEFAGESRFTVVTGDALAADWDVLAGDGPVRVVGNLPYNISTPLLFSMLAAADRIIDFHVMLQREVVERMTAAPGGRDYGRLSVMCQYRARVERLFEVPPGAFDPPPQVHSAVVRGIPRPERALAPAAEARLEQLVRQAFSRRRKTLRNAVAGLADAERIAAAGIDPGDRPERLSVADWVALARATDHSEAP